MADRVRTPRSLAGLRQDWLEAGKSAQFFRNATKERVEDAREAKRRYLDAKFGGRKSLLKVPDWFWDSCISL
jgi:hypothetical protein